MILTNPRCTGYEVWNKQRKQESLIDVDDVALGHQTKLTWNPQSDWVFSDHPVHEALITKNTFEQVRLRLASRGPRSTGREITRHLHPYGFKGMMFHEECGRRMQGNWNHGIAHYRCRYPSEYAIANLIDHPPSVYVREDAFIEQVDTWLADVFQADRIEHSLRMLEESQQTSRLTLDPPPGSLAECERKLARHRAALEAGADPVLVAQWIREVQQERRLAEAQITASNRRPEHNRRMTRNEIKEGGKHLGGLTSVLRTADVRDKWEAYQQLGLKLTYSHEKRVVTVEAEP